MTYYFTKRTTMMPLLPFPSYIKKKEFTSKIAKNVKVLGIFLFLSCLNLNALSTARNFGMSTIALTVLGGGKARELADVLLDVPATITPRVQELHLPVYHFMCQEIEKNCV